MAYTKIRQPKLSDVIEQQLEHLILEGTLRPGEKLLPERELAKQFDVSRPSLREAIQKLEAKGCSLRRQGGGTFVQDNLWQSFSDPLAQLLSGHPESQFDLLENAMPLKVLRLIMLHYAVLMMILSVLKPVMLALLMPMIKGISRRSRMRYCNTN